MLDLAVLLVSVYVAATPARASGQTVSVDVANLLSGFIGAVIGAVIAAVVTYWGARRLQRSDRDHAQHSAARVIVIELIHNQTILQGFKRTGAWQSDLLTRSFWESEGAHAAQGLTPEELVEVGRPYLYAQALENVAAVYRQQNNPGGMLGSQQDQALLDGAIEACGDSIHVLQGHAGFSNEEIARLRKAATA